MFTFLLCNICDGRFKDFTPEKWADYPRQRPQMMVSLKEDYAIIGMSRDDIVMLLGEPSDEDESSLRYYYDRHLYIEFLFSDGKLSDTHTVY